MAIVRGTPPAVLLPAKNYVFEVHEDHYVMEIPRRGKYKDLAPDFFPEEAGEFEILTENNVFYMPAITKVLFATKKYPDLKDNQLFVPHTIEVKEETVNVIGQVIEMSLVTEEETEEDGE